MLFNILFVTLLSNMLSTFENNRYRFPLDGYYAVLTGMLLQRIFERSRQKSMPSHSSYGVPFEDQGKQHANT